MLSVCILGYVFVCVMMRAGTIASTKPTRECVCVYYYRVCAYHNTSVRSRRVCLLHVRVFLAQQAKQV